MNQIPPLARYLSAGIFIGLSGYMLICRKGPNWWIGVRTPWTLADREIWDKSWLLGALLLLGMGLGMLFSWTLFMASIAVLLVLGLLFPPVLYYRKYGTWRYWKDTGWIDYRPAVRCPQCGRIQKLGAAGELAGAHCEACGASLVR
jgi:hypothetical protein